MHKQILSEKQLELIPFVSELELDKYGLVGGTAIALQIGHRRSIDFDFAILNDFKSDVIKDQIRARYKIESILTEEKNETSLAVNTVKLTFFKYPFPIRFEVKIKNNLRMPNLLTLSAMKAYALGRRSKWKDYVDLYFVFKKHSLKKLSNKAKELFKEEFNERLLREQLAYFEDIDYSEKIDYLQGFEVSDNEIKETLTEISLQKR
jgi:hypothetical protein